MLTAACSFKRGSIRLSARRRALGWGLALVAVMSLLYAVTLQPVINGSSDKYAEDVGEFQNVLTQWGTAHPTGYPLYALTGAATASLLRLFGMPAATAASAYSLLTMVLALTGVYVLLVWSDVWPSLAALTAAILGVVFPFWYHASVAEVYSLLMGLIVLAFLIALRWRMDRRTRHLYELAFVSGLAVGHHRLAVLMALPLLILIWPALWSALSERPLRILGALLCLCASFLVYLYLPLRAATGGTWIYGQPDTWDGFWVIVLAREYGALIKPAANLSQLSAGLTQVMAALAETITWPLLSAGVLGLAVSLRIPARRWLSFALLALLLLNVAFAGVYSAAVFLEAALMPAMFAVLVGLGLLAQWVSSLAQSKSVLVALTLLVVATVLGFHNAPAVYAMTHDLGGRQTIDAVRSAQLDRPGEHPVVMALWGRDYFALNFAQHVTGELGGIELVDHRADVKSIVKSGYPLYVFRPTFYLRPLDWWNSHLGHAYLSSYEGDLVRVSDRPVLTEADVSATNAISMAPFILLRDSQVKQVSDDRWLVTLYWQATARPNRDYSISVHASDRSVIARPEDIVSQADSSAPVYGLYPFSNWSPGEIVRDDYLVDSPPDRPIRFVEVGLYTQDAAGNFQSFGRRTLPLR